MLSNISLIFRFLYISTLLHSAFCDSYRLSDCVVPKHYNLKILADVENELEYTGTLEIVTQCLNATNKISLHRDESIKFDKIEMKEIEMNQNYTPGNQVPLDQILYSNKMQYVMITTSEELKENQHYLLYFEFRGNLSESSSGIFRGNFSSSSGASYYAVSIFKPMGARKAFPCFDEPGMTATFQLAIGRNEKYESTSNMQLVKSEPVEGKDGWYWDHFMNSFTMSTYQLCFVIYDKEFTRTERPDNQMQILVRNTIKYSLNIISKTGPKLMTYLQKYFQMPYPFPKLELIALPNLIGDTEAVSTPGLILFKEDLLLYEAFTMKQTEVHYLLQTIAEKITYQWISLLTVEWWSDEWFKTSLSIYNAVKALEEMSGNPSSERNTADAVLQLFHQSGGLPFPEEVMGDSTSVTSAISNTDMKKNKLLLRMAHFLSGRKEIKDISTSLLKKNSFQKIGLHDLWKNFESSAPKGIFAIDAPLSSVMAGWMNQGGFPVVEVTRNYESGTAILRQTAHHSASSNQKNCWWIPIIYATKSDNTQLNVRAWLKCPKKTLEIQSLPSSEWLLLNLHVNSFYRVNYDVQNWKLLHSSLNNPSLYNSNIIPPLNRMQLIDDAFEFTANGNLTYDFLFQFTEFLKFEESYAPWAAFSHNMVNLKWKLNREAFNLLSLYMRNILRRHFNSRKFNNTNDSSANATFSAIITETSCFFEMPDCIREVRGAFKKFLDMKHPFHIEPPFPIDLRDIVFCYAIKHGTINVFDFLLDAFTKSTSIFEKEAMLRGLYCTNDPSLLKKIPRERRVRRKVERREDRNFHFRNVDNQVSGILEDNILLYTGRSLDNSATPNDINNTSEDPSPSTEETDTTSESSTTSEDTTEDTTTSSEQLDTSDESSITPSSSDEEISGDKGESKSDNVGPSLEYIIMRCRFDIVSDLFYKRIMSMNRKRALHSIWLFSERVSTKEDLENFEKFFEDNGEHFRDIGEQIEERIYHIKRNLNRQDEQNHLVVKALKKNLNYRDKRSHAMKKSTHYLLILCSLLRTLSIFLSSND